MKTNLLIILVVLFSGISNFGFGQENVDHIEKKSFKSGERLKYLMHYGIINGGVATLSVVDRKFKGRKIYNAKAVARTIGITDKLYNVHDIYESYFDATNCKPIISIRDITEGSYKTYNKVFYNHVKHWVMSSKSGRHEVPDTIFDVVSAFYYARENIFKDLKINKDVKIPTYFSDEINIMTIRYSGIEVIETDLGKIECMKFNPVVEVGRIFDTQDDLTFWISNDENYLPIRMKMNLFIGSFKCDLVEYSGLKHEINFEK